MPSDDSKLLQEYAANGSQAAFAALVRAHSDMVYAAARRQTTDSTTAEDVTQNVFVVLAQKANRVRNGAVLPAWLLSCTRYAAVNAVKAERRRRAHETKAAIKRSIERASADETVNEHSPLVAALDDALTRLSPRDRSAVALRYLQGNSFADVGRAMFTTEEAARKRVERAIAKMRDYFRRRGIVIDAAALETGLSGQCSQIAPAALTSAVTAKALSSTSITTAFWAAKWARLTLATKFAACVCVTAIAIAASVAVVESNRATASAQPATATTLPAQPFQAVTLAAEQMWQPYIPNDAPPIESVAIKNEEFKRMGKPSITSAGGLDQNVHRAGGPPAAVARSLMAGPQTGAAIAKGFDAAPYRGKRMRLTAYLKSEDVAQQAAMALWIADDKNFATAQDDMGDHWLVGTNDWKRYDIVCDVAPEAATIGIQVYVRGTGAIWIDDAHLDVVSRDVPVNDDHRWRSWTFWPSKYMTSLDHNQLRDGHSTLRVSADSAVRGDWNTYDHTIDDVTLLRGKRVKLSVMIKSENVTLNAGPIMRVVGPDNSTAKHDEQFARRPVHSSMGWMKYTTSMNVPNDAKGLSYGVTINGPGTIWFDELRFEIVQ